TRSVTKASIETGIKKAAFPQESEWSIEQTLDEEFFPN
ncbi:MAG TPA: DUF29 domain-containing protein, partial [Neisseriales bacterium]|nr:DUF29 domain-containing protein [Neisseriales bacterium]